MLLDITIYMLTEFLYLLGFILFIFVISILVSLFIKKGKFPERKKFEHLELVTVVTIMLLDVLLIVYLIIDPTFDFISGLISYQDYYSIMIVSPDSNLYSYLYWLIFRFTVLTYLGVKDERKIIREGVLKS